MTEHAPLWRAAADQRRSKPLLQCGDHTLTYGRALDRIGRLGAWMHDAGWRPGHRVLLAVHDEAHTVTLALALICRGVTPCLLDPATPADEAARVLQGLDAHGLVADDRVTAAWSDIPQVSRLGQRSRLPVAPRDEHGATLFGRLLGRGGSPKRPDAFPHLLDALDMSWPPPRVPHDTDAYVLFTSGTTGGVKGVRIGHRALAAHLGTLARRFGYGPNARIVNTLSLYHADGLIQGPVLAFFCGATCLRPLPFSPPDLPDYLDAPYRLRATHLVVVPAMLSLVDRLGAGQEDCFDYDEFRFVISTGGLLDARLWQRVEQTFGVRVVNVYGLTETVVGGLFSGPDDASHRVGTLGRPVDCEVRLDRGDGDDPDEGELLLRSDAMMTGYLDAPEATAAVVRDGWLHTGDRVRRDDDGLYRYVGRIKNVIISGGFNITPEQVTEVIERHRGVAEAAVVGLPDPDLGERAVAYVVGGPDGAPSSAELAEHCRARLTEYKVPREFVAVDQLPRGPAGKVKVGKLRREHRRPDHGGDLFEVIVEVASEVFHTAPERLGRGATHRSVPGWDSLAHMGFVAELERRLGLTLTVAQIVAIDSLGAAERIAVRALSGRDDG